VALTHQTTKKRGQRGEKILAALAEGLSVSAACKRQRIARFTYYDWRKKYPEFAAAADAAMEAGTDLLEDIALQRAAESSDTLLIFLMKARRPHLYRETTKIQHTGTITHAHRDMTAFNDDEIDALSAVAERVKAIAP